MFPCIHMQIVMNFWKNSPTHTDPQNTRLRLLFSSCSRSSKQLVPEFEFSDLLFYLKVTSSGTCHHQWRQYTVLLVYTSSGMVSLALTSWYNPVFVEWLAAYAELSTKTKMTIWRPKKTSWKRALQLLEIPGREILLVMIHSHQSIPARCRFKEKPPRRSCVTDSCTLRSPAVITPWTHLMGTSPVVCLMCAGVSKEPNACAVRLQLTFMTVPGRGSLLNGWIPTSRRSAVSISFSYNWLASFSPFFLAKNLLYEFQSNSHQNGSGSKLAWACPHKYF